MFASSNYLSVKNRVYCIQILSSSLLQDIQFPLDPVHIPFQFIVLFSVAVHGRLNSISDILGFQIGISCLHSEPVRADRKQIHDSVNAQECHIS